MSFDARGYGRPVVAVLLAAGTLLLVVRGGDAPASAARDFASAPPILPRAFDAIGWLALVSGLWLAWLVATRSVITRIMLGIWLMAVSVELLAPRSSLEHPWAMLTAVMAYMLAPVVWALDGTPRNDQHWARFRPPTTSRRGSEDMA
jgi:lysylphosphatidylglycerol synthetase-like protein (DUF2156 family)